MPSPSSLRRFFEGLGIDEHDEKIITNPKSALVYISESGGVIDIEASRGGGGGSSVDRIFSAGKRLSAALKHMRNCSIQLQVVPKAVQEGIQILEKMSKHFCKEIVQVLIMIMEQLKNDIVVGSNHGRVSINDTHTVIAKKIRDAQRKFQSSLLGYIKLIEILAELSKNHTTKNNNSNNIKPSLSSQQQQSQQSHDYVSTLRDAYSAMVADSILMKRRMKAYFRSQSGKNVSYLNDVSVDLCDYTPFETITEETVHSEDIRHALHELVPVIAKEAYFTAALFGTNNTSSSNANSDAQHQQVVASIEQQHDINREKKRNFEHVKRSVDQSARHFLYYLQRICGVVKDDSSASLSSSSSDNNNKNKDIVAATQAQQPSSSSSGDPMLCLVASIHLHEVLPNYIDREKKGGNHALSLAYIRATLTDLQKRVDKQWIAWVDKQVKWIRSSFPKRLDPNRGPGFGGLLPSFARFPCYLDHILLCCREGRPTPQQGGVGGSSLYTPNLASIKVISHYLQKMASALLESLYECTATVRLGLQQQQQQIANNHSNDYQNSSSGTEAQQQNNSQLQQQQQYISYIMQMQNTIYFTKCIEQRGPEMVDLFEKQTTKANITYQQSMNSYNEWMIVREFPILSSLLLKITTTRNELGDDSIPIEIPAMSFVRIYQDECGTRDNIVTKMRNMYARIERHLLQPNEDDNGGGLERSNSSQSLLIKEIWIQLLQAVCEWFVQWEDIAKHFYNYEIRPTPQEISRIINKRSLLMKTNNRRSGSSSRSTSGTRSISRTRSTTNFENSHSYHHHQNHHSQRHMPSRSSSYSSRQHHAVATNQHNQQMSKTKSINSSRRQSSSRSRSTSRQRTHQQQVLNNRTNHHNNYQHATSSNHDTIVGIFKQTNSKRNLGETNLTKYHKII